MWVCLLKDTQVVLHVVSTSTNKPNCNVGLARQKIIIRALKKLKSECPRGLKPLKIVLLSSATIDDHLALLLSVSWTWLLINIAWLGSTETINGFRLYVKFHYYVGAHLSRA